MIRIGLDDKMQALVHRHRSCSVDFDPLPFGLHCMPPGCTHSGLYFAIEPSSPAVLDCIHIYIYMNCSLVYQFEHSGKVRRAWFKFGFENFYSSLLSGSASFLCAALMSPQRTKQYCPQSEVRIPVVQFDFFTRTSSLAIFEKLIASNPSNLNNI